MSATVKSLRTTISSVILRDKQQKDRVWVLATLDYPNMVLCPQAIFRQRVEHWLRIEQISAFHIGIVDKWQRSQIRILCAKGEYETFVTFL